MGPVWGRQDPGGPHVDPMNLAIWVDTCTCLHIMLSQVHSPETQQEHVSNDVMT